MTDQTKQRFRFKVAITILANNHTEAQAFSETLVETLHREIDRNPFVSPNVVRVEHTSPSYAND